MSTTVITKPKVDIAPSLLRKIKEQTEEMGQVVLHFIYNTPPNVEDMLIRIWPTTFLYDQDSAHKSDMVHVENITLYPVWYRCPPGTTTFFTLIFSGLPKSCTTFDFIEHCTNQAGAFEVRDIARNDSDVYFLRME